MNTILNLYRGRPGFMVVSQSLQFESTLILNHSLDWPYFSHFLLSMVFNWEQFCLSKGIGNVWRHFRLSQLRKERTLLVSKWVEARDTNQRPIILRSHPI